MDPDKPNPMDDPKLLASVMWAVVVLVLGLGLIIAWALTRS